MTSQFQAAEREQTEPTKPHRWAEPGFYRLYSAREIRSSGYKKAHDPHPRTPNVRSTASCGHFRSRRVPRSRAQKRRERILDNRKHDGSPEMARFVGLMRLCEARARLSNRISCCISLLGRAESSYPSQGCALTGRPCSQKRTQLGRRKLALQQWSQRQSTPELVDIQPTLGPGRLL